MDLPTSPDAYDPFVNETFAVERAGAPPLELKLTRVSRQVDNDVQRVFFLVFDGPAEFLPQGQHRLRHRTLDTLELFLVPAARIASGYQYEAAFNLLKGRD